LRLFPPQHRLAQHEEVLDEILEERVASSRGRQVPRGVKRKMSNWGKTPGTQLQQNKGQSGSVTLPP